MFTINNSADNTELLLYSLIYNGYTASQIINQIKDLPPEHHITLRINSDGGEVFEAVALYNYLKDRNTHVIIDGIAASAASIIAMAGKTITMKTGSMLMIHNPSTLVFGESGDLKEAASLLDKIAGTITDIYAQKTGLERSKITELMNAYSWLDAQEALASGFCTKIEDSDTQPEPQKTPEPAPEASEQALKDAYQRGIAAERERLKALDEIMTPSRAKAVNAAKYETLETAQEIALELLKAENEHSAANDLNNFSAPSAFDAEMDAITNIINTRRK